MFAGPVVFFSEGKRKEEGCGKTELQVGNATIILRWEEPAASAGSHYFYHNDETNVDVHPFEAFEQCS